MGAAIIYREETTATVRGTVTVVPGVAPEPDLARVSEPAVIERGIPAAVVYTAAPEV
jgi:hypothetical protein